MPSYHSEHRDSKRVYKFIMLITLLLVIASIITFSLFIKNIYMNMNEIREQEIKFRNEIDRNTVCCDLNSSILNNIIQEKEEQRKKQLKL